MSTTEPKGQSEADHSADLESARILRKIIILSIAASMGIGGAFLASVRGLEPALVLKIDWITWLAGIISVIFTFVFCGHVLPDPGKLENLSPEGIEKSRNELKRWLKIFSVVWTLAMAVTAVICLKDKQPDRLKDFMIGFACAIPPLCFVAWIFFQVKGFLDRDSARVEENSSGQ